MEWLENRTLLSTLNILPGGNLTYSDGPFPPTPNVLTVSTTGSPAYYTFTELSQTITLGSGTTGWSGSGTHTVTGPASSVTSIAITKAGGTINVNDFGQVSGVNYNINGGPGLNTLNLTSTVAGLNYSTAGQIVASPSPTLTYTNIASIHITEPATAPVGTATTIHATEGLAFTNQTVAVFTDSDLGRLRATSPLPSSGATGPPHPQV